MTLKKQEKLSNLLVQSTYVPHRLVHLVHALGHGLDPRDEHVVLRLHLAVVRHGAAVAQNRLNAHALDVELRTELLPLVVKLRRQVAQCRLVDDVIARAQYDRCFVDDSRRRVGVLTANTKDLAVKRKLYDDVTAKLQPIVPKPSYPQCVLVKESHMITLGMLTKCSLTNVCSYCMAGSCCWRMTSSLALLVSERRFLARGLRMQISGVSVCSCTKPLQTVQCQYM